MRSAESASSCADSTVRRVVTPRSVRNRRNDWAPWASSIPFMQKYWSAVSESITSLWYGCRLSCIRSVCSSAEIVTSTLVSSGVRRIISGTSEKRTASRTWAMSLNGARS